MPLKIKYQSIEASVHMKYIKYNAHQSGFSLIETMVAAIVLSMGILTLATLQIRSSQINASTAAHSQVTFFAEQVVDRLRNEFSYKKSVDSSFVITDCDPSLTNTPASVLAELVPSIELDCKINGNRWLKIKATWHDAQWIEKDSDDSIATFSYQIKI